MAANDEDKIPDGEQPGGEFVLIEDDGDDKGKKGAGAEKLEKGAAADPKPEAKQKPEKKGADVDDEDGDDEDEGDTRLSADAGEDDEKKREARRAEKRRRKLRARDARIAKDRQIEELTQTVNKLTEQVGGVAQRVVRSDLSQMAGRRDAAAGRVRQANSLIARALEAGDGSAFTKAQEVRDEAMFEYRQLNAVLQRASEAGGGNDRDSQRRQPAQQQQQQRQEAAPDPLVGKLTEAFTKRVPWFDPNGDDEDSAITVAIDNQVAAEGYDPRTQKYWDVLDERLREKLPHRFEQAQQRTNGGGPRGPALGGRGTSAGGAKFYLSPERIEALKAANKWDDPVVRQKAIKSYAAYDKEHPRQNNAR